MLGVESRLSGVPRRIRGGSDQDESLPILEISMSVTWPGKLRGLDLLLPVYEERVSEIGVQN
jgi:hypothetical protein